MSYTKTNWVDNTTPIDKNNLNKIEQGIYDNSLITEAIADKLNPTDTETYKTAELTEGQITDVIGVNDIIIKGQTEQDGTPTPSAPVDVNVVSGSNVINTRDRNQFKSNVERKQAYPGASSDEIGSKVGYYSSGATYSYIRCAYLQSGKNYTISWTQSKTPASINTRIGVLIDKNDIVLEAISTWINSRNSITISSNNNGYLVLATDINATNIQIEEGSTATTYTNQGKELPLDLGSIELCKIGDYQDYIYKSNNTWYKYKAIDKVVLDGTEEGWNVRQGSNTDLYIFYLVNNLVQNSIKDSSNCLSNYFIVDNKSGLIQKDGGFRITEYSSINRIWLCVNNNVATSVANLKNWLSTHNTTVYYVLETPTSIEITDLDLIEQLEAIYNAPLYEQTNITQENNDLPMVLDITACKDNINGIKAFIRK